MEGEERTPKRQHSAQRSSTLFMDTQTARLLEAALDGDWLSTQAYLDGRVSPEVFFENDGLLMTQMVANPEAGGVVNAIINAMLARYDRCCSLKGPVLERAVEAGCVPLVRWLLKYSIGMDVNAISSQTGLTLLSSAVVSVAEKGKHMFLCKRFWQIVELLLKHGANPNLIASRNGMNALMCAIEFQNIQMVKLLIQHGAVFHQMYYNNGIMVNQLFSLWNMDASGELLQLSLYAGFRLERVGQDKLMRAFSLWRDDPTTLSILYLWHQTPMRHQMSILLSDDVLLMCELRRRFGVPRLQVQCLRVVYGEQLDRSQYPELLFCFPDLDEEAADWERYQNAIMEKKINGV